MSRRAFTLIEMVVALTITAVLVVAMGSALTLAGRAMPQPDDAVTGSLLAHDTLADLAGELAYAINVSEYTATAITFTVADRDDDGTPETIRYAWLGDPTPPGTPGAITRARNGGTPATVLAGVVEFAIGYTVETRNQTVPGPPTAGAEVQLSGFTGASAFADFVVTDQQWPAQTFGLTAPAGATGVSITRVSLNAKQSGSPLGMALVQVQSTDAMDRPSGSPWVQAALDESLLSAAYGWVEVQMDEGVVLPLEDLSLVVQHVSDPQAGSFRGATAVGAMWQTADGGGNWSALPLVNLEHSVHGKFITPGEDVVVVQNLCTTVTLTLQANDDAASRAQRAVALRNRPEVTP